MLVIFFILKVVHYIKNWIIEKGKILIYFTLMYFFWIFGGRWENNNFYLFETDITWHKFDKI